MSCLNPILAVSIMKNDENKHVLKFIPRSEIDDIEIKKLVYGSEEVFLLPCMKCKPCRETYAKDWSIRCTLEAQCHKFNYFLTLTYDEFHINKACKDDFTKFLKNLNYFLNKKKDRPLFFACMERGELTNRLHFHCILFLDKELVLKNPVKLGDFYHYSCELLDQVWSKGFVDVAEFESDCARYVAKYATKQGSCFMSRNLGKTYYLTHRDEIIRDEFKVYGSFSGKPFVNIPKVFVKWFIDDNYQDAQKYKLELKHFQRLGTLSVLHSKGHTSESTILREKIYSFLIKDKFSRERIDL